MKDDLITGSEVLRTDDLERLEMMAVQLDEAKAFIERGTVNHARLAFILLDNAAEVMMRRNIAVLLMHNRTMEQVLKRWKEILAQHPDNAEARRHHDEVEQEVVPKATRKRLANYFDPKVDFLQERGNIQPTESRALKKLHSYRNELYHRDQIRLETVRSACLLYFDLACTLFERLDQSEVHTMTLHKEAPPALRKFKPAGETTDYPTQEDIARSLRSVLGIDGAGFKKTLVTHLTSRLDDLEQMISSADDALFGEWAELMPTGPWRQAIIHLAQWEQEDLPPLEQLLNSKIRYDDSDLARWRQQVSGLQAVADKLELFAAFADIEDSFEPFEAQMTALDIRIDYEQELELDRLRGK